MEPLYTAAKAEKDLDRIPNYRDLNHKFKTAITNVYQLLVATDNKGAPENMRARAGRALAEKITSDLESDAREKYRFEAPVLDWIESYRSQVEAIRKVDHPATRERQYLLVISEWETIVAHEIALIKLSEAMEASTDTFAHPRATYLPNSERSAGNPEEIGRRTEHIHKLIEGIKHLLSIGGKKRDSADDA